eukprot:15448796-Alexandrium_andersonii.AAC.1
MQQRAEIARGTIRIRNETRDTRKRQKRLLDKARNLDEEDLDGPCNACSAKIEIAFCLSRAPLSG